MIVINISLVNVQKFVVVHLKVGFGYDRNLPQNLDGAYPADVVMDIAEDKTITAMNREDDMFQIPAKAVILAMGCRERPRGALNIPGYRPTGIFSAGTAQRLVNIGRLHTNRYFLSRYSSKTC